MSYRKLALIQGSPEWLAARYEHVTASNVPALFGVSPYKTALEYGTELLSRKEKDMGNKAIIFARGHDVEKAAREWVRSQLNIDLLPEVVVSNELNFLLASLDGMDEQKGLVFEAKYVGREALKEAKEGKIKPHHEIQVQAQLLATGFEKAIYFAMDDSGDAAIVDIVANPDTRIEIIEKVTEFWNGLSEGKLPEPSDKDVLTVNDPDLVRLALLHRDMKAIQAQYNAIEENVLARYSESSRVQGEGVSITKYWAKGTVDWNALAKAKRIQPEEQERFRKQGSMRTKVSIK